MQDRQVCILLVYQVDGSFLLAISKSTAGKCIRLAFVDYLLPAMYDCHWLSVWQNDCSVGTDTCVLYMLPLFVHNMSYGVVAYRTE